jgi:tetratricopeptide (TPR) repeat protein
MKRLNLLFVLLVLLVSNVVWAGNISPDSLFVKANGLYKNKKYSEAIVQYKKIVNSGYHSAEIYFNMGNAYYKSGNYSYAILCFEKAKLLNPTNEDIEFNLAKARTFAIDKIEIIPEFFINTWLESIVSRFSSNTWALWGVLLFILSVFLLSGYFLIKSHRIRKILFSVSIVLLLLTVLSVSFSYKTKKYMQNPGTAIIVSPTTSIKSSPDYDATDVFLLHEGTKVILLRKLGGWFEIKLTDGKQGWLESTAIEKI